MEKIDFVVAWVDGSDPEWQAQRARYHQDPGTSDGQAVRYRDWGTLHYWFRAVEKYAPWVNRVHLITWGPIPDWLNTEHPKLHVVRHEDYIPKEYLPTFNSHAIELNLHRIPGLADKFVYFNDDFFLTAPVKPTDFFVKGLPCDSLDETPIPLQCYSLMVHIKTNDVIFLNHHFKKSECRRKNLAKWYSLRTPTVFVKNLILSCVCRDSFFGLNVHHLPQAYLKETFEAVWNADPELLSETSSHKFRDARDVSQCVFKFWQLGSGKFYPCNKRKYGGWFPGGYDIDGACRAIRSRKYKYICYNDAPDVDFVTNKVLLHAAFDDVLPEKCAYER